VALVVVNSQDLVLWCERITLPNSWQFPQGGIDPGEDAESAMWREGSEELGLRDPRAHMVIEKVLEESIRYDFPADVIQYFLDRNGRSWLGQAQQFFMLRFTGDEQAITLQPPPGVEAEFSRWEWGSTERIDSVVAFKRQACIDALTGFGLM